MRLSENEIEVMEREDMTYEVFRHMGKYFAEVHFRGSYRWDTYKLGNKSGYKTKRGAMNAIKRDAARPRGFAPNGLTIVGC